MARSKPATAAADPGTRHAGRRALTYIEPNRILVRGYRLDELMGRVNFGEAMYLLLTGELPTPSIGRLVDAMLVSFIDHGATPPSTLAARNAATTGASLRGSVAAGVLGFGPHYGGDVARLPPVARGRPGARANGHVDRGGRDRARRADGQRRGAPAAGIRPPVPHDRSARDAAAADRARAGSGPGAHAADPRDRARALAPPRRCRIARCRSTSTAPSPPSAATSACRRRWPTRCSSSRACRAWPRTRSRNRRREAPMRVIDPISYDYDGPSDRRLPDRRK